MAIGLVNPQGCVISNCLCGSQWRLLSYARTKFKIFCSIYYFQSQLQSKLWFCIKWTKIQWKNEETLRGRRMVNNSARTKERQILPKSMKKDFVEEIFLHTTWSISLTRRHAWHLAIMTRSVPTYLAVWPDWANYWTLGNFLKLLATIIYPNLSHSQAIFIGVKSYHFWRFFSSHTGHYGQKSFMK